MNEDWEWRFALLQRQKVIEAAQNVADKLTKDDPCFGGSHCCCCGPGEECCDCGAIMP